MSATLISISKIAAAKHTIIFRHLILEIYNMANKQIDEIHCSNGLYSINHRPCDEDGKALTAVSISVDSLHRRMGHIAPEAARDLIQKGLVSAVIESDPSSIVQAVATLPRDGVIRWRAQVAVRAEYSWSAIERQLEAIYMKLLGRPGAPHEAATAKN